MSPDNYHKDRIANRKLHPETLMMGYGYSPALSEGALKPPIFLTSTFVFETAQQGKDFFDLTAGPAPAARRARSRAWSIRASTIPNFEILEDRLAVWDEAERSRRVRQRHGGDRHRRCWPSCGRATRILHSRPLYGGTETLLRNQLTAFGITPVGFTDGCEPAQIAAPRPRQPCAPRAASA